MSPEFPLPIFRTQRLRRHPQLRRLLAECHVNMGDLICPLFVKAGKNIRRPLVSLPGHYQWSVDELEPELAHIHALGIPGVILFGLPAYKDAVGSASWQSDGVVQSAIGLLKARYPNLLVIADLCFCEYTDHGHCGVLQSSHNALIDNDQSLEFLVDQAVSLAAAGADVIAPSGMLDGGVRAIRHGLDMAGYHYIPILSYAVKFSSALYAPFREAAEGEPKQGDRKTYQLDPANASLALAKAAADVAEGADILMVKPAHTYLDMICRIKQKFLEVPVWAYHVSGEYSMVKAAGSLGWLDANAVMWESLIAIKRAGADVIITYAAKEIAQILKGSV